MLNLTDLRKLNKTSEEMDTLGFENLSGMSYLQWREERIKFGLSATVDDAWEWAMDMAFINNKKKIKK